MAQGRAENARTTADQARHIHSKSAFEGTAAPIQRAIIGGVLVASGARRGGLVGWLVAIAGAYVVRRAAGELLAQVHDQMFAARPDLERRYGEAHDRDVVEEASWESFPASDPPAFTH